MFLMYLVHKVYWHIKHTLEFQQKVFREVRILFDLGWQCSGLILPGLPPLSQDTHCPARRTAVAGQKLAKLYSSAPAVSRETLVQQMSHGSARSLPHAFIHSLFYF